MRERHGATAEFAFDQCKIEMGKTRATNLFGKVACIKAEIYHFLLERFTKLVWHLTALLNFTLIWINFVFNKTTDRIDDHILLFAQSKLHAYIPFVTSLKSP